MVIVFDVDGTLTPQRAASYGEFDRALLPGVREKCAALRASGHTLVLCSNQGGARRDRTPRITMGAMHAHLRWVSQEIGASGYWFATTPPRKKPSPAMLYEIAAYFGIEVTRLLFVGDAETDAAAAAAAACMFKWACELFV